MNDAISYVPYNVIIAAKNGDTAAITTVIQHYNPYIALQSFRAYEKAGINDPSVSIEDIEERIRMKLIVSITTHYKPPEPPV